MNNTTDIEEEILSGDIDTLELQENLACRTNDELLDIIIQLVKLLKWYNQQLQLRW